MITINVYVSGQDTERASAALPVTPGLHRETTESVVEVSAGPPAFSEEGDRINFDESRASGATTATSATAISAGPAPEDVSRQASGLSSPASGSDTPEEDWINAGPASLDFQAAPQHSQED
jgi:hypothetical protein